ncbi:PH domain-containing protein [Pontibacter sp. KCTC 32443]|uniref:PH domain-containing protein n=2 Tax=Pontibacter TaxID=323449 RepID=UPI00164DEA5A|nr:PH domain-containing protein [Pontibacter sp. KCTC 32443]MBC5775969.1 PH domain-containing protein [Pontibacter sp. KCTC 32443]
MKEYKANRRAPIPYLIVLLVLLPFVIYITNTEGFSERPYILLPLIAPMGLLLRVFYGTLYKVEDGKLMYKSGFLWSEINISNIRQLVIGETMWVGLRPASKGIIVKYNRYDEIYIAPENNLELVEDLKTINPSIEIIYKD